jgi:uncharacterized metal-binding protein YceD (DUF177 family)
MKLNNDYLIPFTGLKLGKHQFAFEIDNAFFVSFEYDEFNNAKVFLDLELDKKSTFMELRFSFKGHVNVPCDVTMEDFDLPIQSENKLVVKFGDEFNNEDEELLIIPHSSHEIDISQYVYEIILLSVPTKRVHPGIKDGTLQSDILTKLKELTPKKENTIEKTDPMWDKLKKLLTDK